MSVDVRWAASGPPSSPPESVGGRAAGWLRKVGAGAVATVIVSVGFVPLAAPAGAVAPPYQMTSYAGDGNTGSAASGHVTHPKAITVKSDGTVLVVTSQGPGSTVFSVAANGALTPLAGGASAGATYTAGMTATNMYFDNVTGIVDDGNGNTYIADNGFQASYIYRVTAGALTRIAGDGTQTAPTAGGVAAGAAAGNPSSLAYRNGTLFFTSQTGHRVFKIDGQGKYQVVAGAGTQGSTIDANGDPAATQLDAPSGLAFDSAGDLYIGDGSNNRVLKIGYTTGGTISRYVGTAGSPAYGPLPVGGTDDANATAIGGQVSLAVDAADNLLLGFANAAQVARVDPNGKIERIAGKNSSFTPGPGLENGTGSVSGIAVKPGGTAGDPVFLAADSLSRVLRLGVLSGAPTAVSGTPGNQQVSLTWSAPTGGGPAVTGYIVTPSRYNIAQSSQTFNSASTSATVTGLTNGADYTFKVQAVSAEGAGAASAASSSIIPVGPPAPPSITQVTPGNEMVSVQWGFTPNNGGSPLTGYQVTPLINGVAQTPQVFDDSQRSRQITGLTNGTAYTFTVAAINAIGTGSESATSSSATPVGQPTAPLNAGGVPGDQQVTLSWDLPANDGGNPIDSYQVETFTGGASQGTTDTGSPARNYLLASLTNGTAYTFTIRAHTTLGWGPASAATSSVTPVAPGPNPVTSLTATPGDGQATVVFAAPVGGQPVTGGYESSTDGTTWVPLNTTAGTGLNTGKLVGIVTGLPNGSAVTLRVRAVGTSGNSTPLSANNGAAITPNPLPPVPGTVTATPRDTGVDLSFTPSTGGTAGTISGYVYSVDAGATWTALSTSGSSTLTGSITGLANGTSYSVLVAADSPQGRSTPTTAAVVTPVGVPAAPASATATAGNASIALSFPAVSSTSATPVTGYAVSLDGGTSWEPLTTSGTTTLTANVTTFGGQALVNGTAFAVRIAAVNTGGNGTVVSAGSVTPNVATVAPVISSVVGGSTTATVNITAPSRANGSSAITGYEYSLDGGSWTTLTLSGPASAATPTGSIASLSNGISYLVKVRALNASGPGASSAGVSVTPYGLPAAPSALKAWAGNGSLALSFTEAVSSSGSPVTGYEYSLAGPGGPWVTLTPTSPPGATTVTGLIPGLTNSTAYTLQVRSTNTTATPAITSASGAVTSPATTTPVSVPDLPASFVAMGTNGGLSLSIDGPTSTGGSAVTGYEVSVDGGANWSALSTLSPALPAAGPYTATVAPLTNGTTYPTLVRAVTATGPGLPAASEAIPGNATPTAPRYLTLTPGPGSATVSFTPPATAGAGAVTAYAYQVGGTGPWTALTTTASGSRLTATITGLSAGQASMITVAAVTASGLNPPAGASANASVTPTSPPPQSGGGGGGGGASSGGGSSSGGSGGAGAPSGPLTLPRVGVLAGGGSGSGSGSGGGSGAPSVSLGLGRLNLASAAAPGTKATYTSSTPSVCTVSAAGVVTMKGTGSCSVEATPSGGGDKSTLAFQVAEPPNVAARLSAPTTRLGGVDRIDTSVEVAKKLSADGSASSLVVASATSYADSLAGARLASIGGGPLLLTGQGGLDTDVAAEIKRVLISGGTVYVLGKESALSPAVVSALQTTVGGATAKGSAATTTSSVTRLGGDDRYATAVAIAEEVVSVTGDEGPIYLTTGRDFADGVGASALASRTGGVVLLTDGKVMPEATKAYLAKHDPKGERVVPIGGPAVEAVKSVSMSAAAGRALSGEDRYATAAAIAKQFVKEGGKVTAVGVSTGKNWPDAVTGAAAMGALRGPLLLTTPSSVPTPTLETLTSMKGDLSKGVAFGGSTAIEDKAYQQLAALLPKG